jgi:hypothetical protein
MGDVFTAAIDYIFLVRMNMGADGSCFPPFITPADRSAGYRTLSVCLISSMGALGLRGETSTNPKGPGDSGGGAH